MAPAIANVGGSGAGGLSSPLVVAVVASAALHVALLAGLPDLWTYSATPATAPLNARLARGAPEPATAIPDPPAPPAAEPTAPRPAVKTQRPPARPMPAALPKPREREAVVTPARDPVAQVAAAPPATVGSAPAVGEPTAVPRPGDDAPDLGSLAQFRLALIGTAKRFRLYPESAVERGWHGRVTVRLAFDAEGAVTAALVRRSSGHATLDEHALDMLRKAAALTPVPPALRSREFAVEVPVAFELRGEG
jgi:protein TonB